MKLMSKKEIPTEICYDLTVRKNHNFFANGICVHNSNAGIAQERKGAIPWYQSRNNIITPENDNAGFARYMDEVVGTDQLTKFMDNIRYTTRADDDELLVVFGEWCGGNIQKGVGITELDKMFVVFGVRLGDDETTHWVRVGALPIELFRLPEHRIFNIYEFPTFHLDIDFDEPGLYQNDLVKLTEEVERECPVAKHFLNQFNKMEVKMVNNEIISKLKLPPTIQNSVKEILKELVLSGMTEPSITLFFD